MFSNNIEKMSTTTPKKALRSELGLKTRTSNKLEEKKLEPYEPRNLLAEQVIDAVNEYFDEREQNYQDLQETPKKDDLELTADVYDDVPLVASRKHENAGLFLNMAGHVKPVSSKNTVSTNMSQAVMGGITFSNNYNAYGLKNTDIPQDGLTKEKIRKGFYTRYQYQPQRFWGNISNEGLLESYGGPWTKKYQGTPMV